MSSPFFLLLSLFLLLLSSSFAMPGGWSNLSPTDPEVVKCTNFYLEKGSLAAAGATKHAVKQAQKQVR